MKLRGIVDSCGKNQIPGIKTRIGYIAISDIQFFPRTEAELGGQAQGDSVVLSEEFILNPGADWRYVDILISSGGVKDMLEGVIGGHSIINQLSFFVVGAEADQRAWADTLLLYNGCLIFRIPTRSDELILGDLNTGLYLRDLQEGINQKHGYAYSLSCTIGHTAKIYRPSFTKLVFDGQQLSFDGSILIF